MVGGKQRVNTKRNNLLKKVMWGGRRQKGMKQNTGNLGIYGSSG